jgi:hypothetical protein
MSKQRHTSICKMLAACSALLFFCGVASAQGAGNIAGAGIANTSHDTRMWSFDWTAGQVCVICHAPHNTNVSGPLWNHTESAVTSYTTYGSTTMNATVGQPSAVSKLCLSCHDGTVAIMSYGGSVGGMTLIDAAGATARSVLGVDLSNDHPIGFTYDAALVAKDPTKLKPVSTAVTVGANKVGTIASLLLESGTRMECSSCHDVHNKLTVATASGTGLVKVKMGASSLCVTCHIK